MSKTKLFPATPTNIIVLPPSINEVRSDELRVMIDLFTDELNAADLRALAMLRNDDWESILVSERRYRRLNARISEGQPKIERSLVTPLQCSFLDSLSDDAITCALAMTGTNDLQWEFAERFEKHNTVWFYTGDSDTLVSWLLSLQTSPRLSAVLAGYAIHDDDESDEDHDGYCTLQVMANFLCPNDVSRCEHIRAIGAWVRACADLPDGKQLTLYADYQSAQCVETLSVKAYHVEV